MTDQAPSQPSLVPGTGTDADLDTDTDIVAAALAQLEADGVAVVPGVLDDDEAAAALDALWAASRESVRRGTPAHIVGLDPNASNVRVFNLIDLDPLFAALVAHPLVEQIVGGLLGREYIVSNFTANIARPGSESMVVHSDLSAVLPEPWTSPQSVNVIWCFTDVHGDNGATLHLPGSHRFQRLADVPRRAIDQMVPFVAQAGSIVIMEGRIWHTSGRNTTADEDRALAFAYYTKPYIRPQWNHSVSLSPEVQATMSPLMRYRLGLEVTLNLPPADLFDVAGA